MREPTERVALQDPAAARRPVRDRTATPLEMAFEGEFARGTQTPSDLSAPSFGEAAPSHASAPAAPSTDLDMPLTFEPEPPREPARPIAQVMSKHTTPQDVTFGGLLKRSLSLRPR